MDWLADEQALAIGLGAVLAIWAVLIGVDVYRRIKGRKRRMTSPFREWFQTISILWALAAIAVWAWIASGRSYEALGLGAGDGEGWKLGLAWGLTIAFMGQQIVQLLSVRNNEETRRQVREIVFGSGDYDQIMPRRRQDVWGYQLLAVTAGITEEIVFRGFLIGVFALFMPVWPAAGLALVIFVVAHAYQGWKGLLRILPISVVLTVIFVLSGSLWPGILLHIAVDVLSGLMVWYLLPPDGYVKVGGATEDAMDAQLAG